LFVIPEGNLLVLNSESPEERQIAAVNHLNYHEFRVTADRGTFVKSERSKRFVVYCTTASALACLTLCPTAAQAQSPTSTTPQFEVSSVKQNLSQSTSSNTNSRLPDRFIATNVPLFFLILDAYELKGYQLIGAPDWTWDKAYDVVGTYPGAQRPPAHEIHLMLQNLLAKRFGLKLHPEQREIPAYDLVLARKDGRLGPQLLKSNIDCAAWITAGRPQTDAGPSSLSPTGKRPVCTVVATRKWMEGGARTIQDLAGPLGAMVDRPVVDRTGLTAAYDIDLQWDPDLHADAAANATSTEAPSIFTALQEQLGLKLVSQKEKFDVIVVDQVRPPSPN